MENVRTDALAPEHLERLLEVGRALVAAHEPDAVLRLVLDAASDLTGARYAAIGVLDAEKRELARFVFTGIPEEVREQIGELPRGRGILGELIRHPEPLRLSRISDHPRSYGFPTGHPPMGTFLGAPVMIRGEVFGNIYLAEKAGGAHFDERDEQLIVVLAAWAAVAVDNARAHTTSEEGRRKAERLLRGLEANASLGREVSGETDLARVLELVVKRARALVDARSCIVVLREPDGLTIAAAAGRYPAESIGSMVTDAEVAQRLTQIATTPGPPLRVGRVDVPGIEREEIVACSLRSRGQALGVLVATAPEAGGEALSDDDLEALDTFATSAATAIGATRRLEDERLRLTIAASERERHRWARELHDETLQELGALKMMQETALQLDDPQTLRRALTRAAVHVDEVIDALHGLITELRPAALDQLGIDAAVQSLVERIRERAGLRIEADIDLGGEPGSAQRFDPELEATAYRLVQEALTNVIKHADASHVRVLVEVRDKVLALRVTDDGRGFDLDARTAGYGLVGMRERVELAGGSLEIGRGEGGGTRIAATLPLVAAGTTDPPP
jgi:signal transduction histidine kinase